MTSISQRQILGCRENLRRTRAFVSTVVVKCYDNGTSVRTPECRIKLVFSRKRNRKLWQKSTLWERRYSFGGELLNFNRRGKWLSQPSASFKPQPPLHGGFINWTELQSSDGTQRKLLAGILILRTLKEANHRGYLEVLLDSLKIYMEIVWRHGLEKRFPANICC